jgi:hypothetical protein
MKAFCRCAIEATNEKLGRRRSQESISRMDNRVRGYCVLGGRRMGYATYSHGRKSLSAGIYEDLSVCRSVGRSACLSVCRSVCLSVGRSACLSVGLPVCLPDCLFVCLRSSTMADLGSTSSVLPSLSYGELRMVELVDLVKPGSAVAQMEADSPWLSREEFQGCV